MDEVFLLLDHEELKYEGPFFSRIDADRKCADRNGGGVKRRKHPKYGTRRRRLQSIFQSTHRADLVGVDGLYRIRTRGEAEPRILGDRRRELVADYKIWLPPLLNDWADALAEVNGYGGQRRSTWDALSILTMLGGPFQFLRSGDESLKQLHFEVMPNNEFERPSPEHNRQREALCVHYLSTAPAERKARYLGMSKATYLRCVDAAHHRIAERWIP
jgi:hypothetical protein